MRTNPTPEAVNDEFHDEENEFLKQFMNLYADDIEEIIELSEMLQNIR